MHFSQSVAPLVIHATCQLHSLRQRRKIIGVEGHVHNWELLIVAFSGTLARWLGGLKRLASGEGEIERVIEVGHLGQILQQLLLAGFGDAADDRVLILSVQQQNLGKIFFVDRVLLSDRVEDATHLRVWFHFDNLFAN